MRESWFDRLTPLQQVALALHHGAAGVRARVRARAAHRRRCPVIGVTALLVLGALVMVWGTVRTFARADWPQQEAAADEYIELLRSTRPAPSPRMLVPDPVPGEFEYALPFTYPPPGTMPVFDVVEALGYRRLTPDERERIAAAFAEADAAPRARFRFRYSA